MKKLLPILLLVFIISPQFALAQVDDLNSTTDEVQVDTKPPMGKPNPNSANAEDPNSVRSQVQDARENAQQARLVGIRQMSGNMVRRLNAAVVRLETMGGRISSRLTKLEQEGAEVSALNEDLVQAQESLAQTKTDIASLETEIEFALTGDNPKIAFAQIKSSITSIKTELKTVLETYAQIVRQMKGLGGNPKTQTATSSAEVE